MESLNHNMFLTSMSHLVFKCHYIIESRPITRWSGDENPHLTDRRAIRFLVEQFQFQEESIPYGSKANIAQKMHHICKSFGAFLCFRACFSILVWYVKVCVCIMCTHASVCLGLMFACTRDIKHCSTCTPSQFHIFDIDNGWNVHIFQMEYVPI